MTAPSRALRQIEAWRRNETFLRTAEAGGASIIFQVGRLLIRDGAIIAKLPSRPNSRRRRAQSRQDGSHV